MVSLNARLSITRAIRASTNKTARKSTAMEDSVSEMMARQRCFSNDSCDFSVVGSILYGDEPHRQYSSNNWSHMQETEKEDEKEMEMHLRSSDISASTHQGKHDDEEDAVFEELFHADEHDDDFDAFDVRPSSLPWLPYPISKSLLGSSKSLNSASTCSSSSSCNDDYEDVVAMEVTDICDERPAPKLWNGRSVPRRFARNMGHLRCIGTDDDEGNGNNSNNSDTNDDDEDDFTNIPLGIFDMWGALEQQEDSDYMKFLAPSFAPQEEKTRNGNNEPKKKESLARKKKQRAPMRRYGLNMGPVKRLGGSIRQSRRNSYIDDTVIPEDILLPVGMLDEYRKVWFEFETREEEGEEEQVDAHRNSKKQLRPWAKVFSNSKSRLSSQQ